MSGEARRPTSAAVILVILPSLLFALLPGRAGAVTATVSYPDFADVSGWELNGSAGQVTRLVDDVPVLRLTPAANDQSGSAFLTDAITLAADASFSAYFAFELRRPGGSYLDIDGRGADGVVFIVNGTPDTAGQLGCGIGYGGLLSSIAVEFDTFANHGSRACGWVQDIDGNHVGINTRGNLRSVASETVSQRMNDGHRWHAWVDYDGATDLLEVRLSDGPERPSDAYVSASLDLPAILGSTDAYVGFTAGTGGAFNDHDLIAFTFVGEYGPLGDGGVPQDTTPPVIEVDIAGTEGGGGWYTSDVEVMWTITDPESEVISRTGCDLTVVDEDTRGVDLTCEATSAGGTSSGTVTVRRDTTAPTITFEGAQLTYRLTDAVQVDCVATDATSGVVDDGCEDIDTTAWAFGAGTVELHAEATDAAGNVTFATVTFAVVVDADGLCALTEQFVSRDRIARSMCAQLHGAERARLRGNDSAAEGILDAYRNHVRAQAGKTLAPEDAASLIELSGHL